MVSCRQTVCKRNLTAFQKEGPTLPNRYQAWLFLRPGAAREILSLEHKDEVLDPCPIGVVAQSILTTDFSDPECARQWAAKLGIEEIHIVPGGRPASLEEVLADEPVPLSKESLLPGNPELEARFRAWHSSSPKGSFLQQQKRLMGAYLAIVLLLPKPTWFQEASPSRRLGIFRHRYPAAMDEIKERLLHGVAVLPGGIDIFRGSILPDGKPNERLMRQLNRIERAYRPGMGELVVPEGEWEAEFRRLASEPPGDLQKDMQATEGEIYPLGVVEIVADDILGLAWQELLLLAQYDVGLKKCPRCGTYFAPVKPQAIYCGACAPRNYSRQGRYRKRLLSRMTPDERQEYDRKAAVYSCAYRRRKAGLDRCFKKDCEHFARCSLGQPQPENIEKPPRK